MTTRMPPHRCSDCAFADLWPTPSRPSNDLILNAPAQVGRELSNDEPDPEPEAAFGPARLVWSNDSDTKRAAWAALSAKLMANDAPETEAAGPTAMCLQ